MRSNKKLLALAIATAPLWQVASAIAADAGKPNIDLNIEEVVITARLKSSAEDVVFERMEHEAVTDLLSSELIGRIGDSTVATALRRVPGVTLVDDKFIYVRGLGERYSSSLLNGASVPSPDLTRSVLPLDIFPTSIVESLAVQKGFTVDMPAAFGGGSVDIRTKSIPEEFLFNVEIGTSHNTETSGSGLSYNGGGDDEWGTDDGTRALSGDIRGALDTYLGDIGVNNILNVIQRQDSSLGREDAELINRQLAKSLKRDISIYNDDPGENIEGQVNLGNRFYFDNGMEFGFLSGLSYDHNFDTVTSVDREFSDPDELVGNRTESTRSVDITGNLGFGLRVNGEQEISTTSLFLRNSDDVAAIRDYHVPNRPLSGNLGSRSYDIRFEEREMLVNQVKGTHVWGEETRELLGLESWGEKLPFLDLLKVEWYYSDAEVDSEIPSEINVAAITQTVPGTGEVLGSVVQPGASMADYRFTELEDEVLSQGWEASLPLVMGSFDVEISGGWDYVRKTRIYKQLDFQLGSTDSSVTAVTGQDLGDLFGDANLDNDDLGFGLNVSPATARSYLAAVTNESIFGQFDATWQDTWRIIVGARYEEYVQAALPWQPLNYTSSQISTDPVELEKAVFTDDQVYPSLSMVYMGQNFWAETFQLRFSYSETVVRPDLREVSDASYRDPITDFLVFGNPNVVPSDLKNYDLRAEWFFDNGDNFTVSLFYKDIANPIEYFEVAGGGETLPSSQIINADSGEITGIEVEWLKELSFLGDAFSPFFVSGNLTFLDHELTVGTAADAPTNAVRGLSGASDYVANIQLGFDSEDGKHSAMLVYNVYDERLYTAGRLGTPDTFEQPFNSLDLTYSFYMNDSITIKAKLKNLLDESITLEQGGVEIYEEEKGLAGSLAVQWQF
ncbi:MAG: TonB-dependent receptor [Porticoccaceae bacterium]|nr:TonB-dependent receptor [Porticoccaceae bacterium]